MFKDSPLKIKRLKKLLILMLILIIGLSLLIIFITQTIKSYPITIQKDITDKFNNISYNLEFGGINKKVKQITTDYSKLFDGYSNIIITNDRGDVLFHLNNGYLSEKNKFLVLVNPSNDNEYESDIAYLIDSKNKIKYAAQLGLYSNMNNLKTQSSQNSLTKSLFMNEESDEEYFDDEDLGDGETVNSSNVTYESTPDSDIIMNYNYIASKGYNLYCLYNSEHQYNNYFKFTTLMKRVKKYLEYIIIGLSALFFTFLFLLLFKIKSLKRLDLHEELERSDIVCPHCGKKISVSKQQE